mmetsp:Transcript_5512/g.22858  ORF Transcript_5512/g.22858 Transcript_5512/m.22858 type:complete len:272 (-) Transcript_5512:229-1044(-)
MVSASISLAGSPVARSASSGTATSTRSPSSSASSESDDGMNAHSARAATVLGGSADAVSGGASAVVAVFAEAEEEEASLVAAGLAASSSSSCSDASPVTLPPVQKAMARARSEGTSTRAWSQASRALASRASRALRTVSARSAVTEVSALAPSSSATSRNCLSNAPTSSTDLTAAGGASRDDAAARSLIDSVRRPSWAASDEAFFTVARRSARSSFSPAERLSRRDDTVRRDAPGRCDSGPLRLTGIPPADDDAAALGLLLAAAAAATTWT